MSREGVRTSDERLAFGDGEQGERELRALHLLRGVLVPALEARQAADTHHHEAVAVFKFHARGLGRNGHLDPEPGLHHVDAGLVAGVEAGLDSLGDDRLRLLGRNRSLRNLTFHREHRGRHAEPEISLHNLSLQNKPTQCSSQPFCIITELGLW
ncbi:MAG: hypothetical protein CO137_02775 [Candidatus Magasanikbacteria bacterium CG_4_9_14_3_um_filter_32_9]|uniref:Uncharacterized protein n=1 Tax=Candidatus Magasanikbacteria bacterium CG_4_9_14_3_um_filter_32_9 TaxID=1974644 RepID=A0A2M7Z6L2_9BACT|nr:MAG: hypothetical protein CO137_02775 [Candidatus Magasanikbacteria bacterium CG_4_9_14_3_um_filter_32_9]